MNESNIEHESFAVLQISRVTGDSVNLFGSSIEHQHVIELQILPARIHRENEIDWIFPKGIPYITVRMSNSQFAEAITSMNLGAGTPVTLVSIRENEQYKIVEPVPFIDKKLQFDNEFRDTMRAFSDKLDKEKNEILLMTEKMPKKFQTEVEKKIKNMYKEISDHIPFIKRQFTEQMDKTTLEAKGEIEGFFINKIHNLGIKELKRTDILQLK